MTSTVLISIFRWIRFHLDPVFHRTVTVLFGLAHYIYFAIYNILSSDVKSLSWREKLILFIIWSFAIKFRLMTSVNWFSPDIAICLQKVIFWNWENLTHNSFPLLLKATLLGYRFNVNWGVAKTIKVTNDTTLLPNLHSQLSFRDSLQNLEKKISVSEPSFFFSLGIIFPMALISLFNTTIDLLYSMVIRIPP